MNEKYEQIKFDSWQELAKYVIDGGEVYVDCQRRIKFSGVAFNCDIEIVFSNKNYLYTKKQPTLEELIAIKPRLCWVWDNKSNNRYIRVVECVFNGYYRTGSIEYDNAQMLTDDEIKQFLNGE